MGRSLHDLHPRVHPERRKWIPRRTRTHADRRLGILGPTKAACTWRDRQPRQWLTARKPRSRLHLRGLLLRWALSYSDGLNSNRADDPIERTREMRKLIVSTFLTLDGVMQAPGGPAEDDSEGFAHGGWSVNYWDDQMGEVMGAAMGVPFDLVLGRRTYDIFAAHWPHATEEQGAKPLNDATKYVASRSQPTLEWSNSVLIKGDAAEGIAALKKQDGPELQVHGSGSLIQTLLHHNLIDQYRLWVFPLVIGSGKRLFSEGTIPQGLTLVDSQVSSTGVMIGTYEPAGEIVTGSFALD